MSLKINTQLLKILANPDLTLCTSDHDWSFEMVNLGRLKITSGKLVISDPSLLNSKDFLKDFKISSGDYEVEACIAKLTTENSPNSEIDERIGLLKLACRKIIQ